MQNPTFPTFVVAALFCAAALASNLAGARPKAHPDSVEVAPSVETDPIPKRSGELDDPAVWVHPTDPARSRVIGTLKKAGLAVYDLAGRQVQHLASGRMNNVDLRHGFELAGEDVALVLASNTDSKRGHVAAFTIGADGLLEPYDLELIEPDPPLRKPIYGLCMYRSPYSDELYVFFAAQRGEVQQWQLGGGDAITAEPVRHFQAPGRTEGCVADDERGVLYLGVEDGGIHQIDAEPDGGVETELIAPVAPTGHLVPDVEGLALHYTAGGGGYLIASSQGSSDFVVYERGGDHAFVARFRIGDAGGIDAVTKTDGIEVSGLPLGPAFPNGLFIAQDDKNPGSQQNFKLVSWQDVATGTTPPLVIDTSVDPRR